MTVRNFEKKEGSRAEITVEFSAREFENALDNAFNKNKNDLRVKGIRRHKATRAALEEEYGESVFYEDAFGELFPEGLDFAAAELKVNPVGQISVTDFKVNDDRSVTVTYDIALYPKVTMGAYKGIKVAWPSVAVSDSQVEDEVNAARRRMARLQPVEREARTGDSANIDFEGFMDGVAFEGGKDENYDIVLGSDTFIPGFEAQIAGMKPGEERDINVTFPEDYDPRFAGKPAVFRVKLNSLAENILPELDDDFAMDVSGSGTVGEYIAGVRKELEARAAEESEMAFRDAVMEKVLEGMSGDIPEEMINMRIDSVVKNYENDFARQGVPFDQYLQYMGMDMEGFRQSLRPAALQQVKVDLAFEAVAELEGLCATDEEIEAGYASIGKEYGMEAAKVREHIARGDMELHIRLEKAKNLIFSTAVREE